MINPKFNVGQKVIATYAGNEYSVFIAKVERNQLGDFIYGVNIVGIYQNYCYFEEKNLKI